MKSEHSTTSASSGVSTSNSSDSLNAIVTNSRNLDSKNAWVRYTLVKGTVLKSVPELNLNDFQRRCRSSIRSLGFKKRKKNKESVSSDDASILKGLSGLDHIGLYCHPPRSPWYPQSERSFPISEECTSSLYSPVQQHRSDSYVESRQRDEIIKLRERLNDLETTSKAEIKACIKHHHL